MANKKIQTLKGFRDFFPIDVKKRNWLKKIIVDVFEAWGYEPFETPVLEPLEAFAGQIGEDEKLFFSFKDSGGRDVALRYDQTVPIIRALGQYSGQINYPFRRYQIQMAYRAEKPQKGRYREFLQCDADIFGLKSAYADAEVIALSLDIYRNIGFKEYVVKVNDRKLLEGIPYEAISAIDKLDKIGEEGVIADMAKRGIEKSKAEEYFQYVQNLQPNDTIKTIFKYLESYGFNKSSYEFDPTIARSFSYSDGPIWEVKIPGLSGSVLGGERYDKLSKNITGQEIPATGFGLGFDRTLEAAEELGLVPEVKDNDNVLMTVFSEETLQESLKVVKKLREDFVDVEVYPIPGDGLGKQLKYASKKGIEIVLIMGEDEIKKGKVLMRNMTTGEQKEYEWDLLPI